MIQFSIQISDLIHLCKLAANVTRKRENVRAAQFVLFSIGDDTSILTATSSDVENTLITTHLLINKGAPGVVAVHAEKLLAVASDLSREYTNLTVQETTDSRLTLAAGKSKVTLACLPKQKYLDVPAIPSTSQCIVVPQIQLKQSIAAVQHAIAESGNRVFCSALISYEDSRLKLVGANGPKLAVATIHNIPDTDAPDFSAILDRRTLEILAKTICTSPNEDMHMSSMGTKACFSTPGRTLIASTIADTYPDYTRIFPKTILFSTIIPTINLINKLQIVNTMTFDSHFTKWNFLKDTLTITSRDSEIGDAKEEITLQQTLEDPFTIGLNSKFVLDTLKALVSWKLKDTALSFSGDTTPVCITGTQQNIDVQTLIMPMRL